MQIFNPYGTEITIQTDGTFYKAEGIGVEYFSQFIEGVIAAYIEDIQENETFSSTREGINYKSVFSEKLTKKNDGKKSFLIIPSKDYLS